ncbi:MAG: hypothetical protein HY819_10140 [Acidobacteria bacterium]|nr:hypothetical protein [Acidobacteriota bacterium]
MKKILVLWLFVFFTVVSINNSFNGSVLAQETKKLPKIWVIHTDEVYPGKVNEFERLVQIQSTNLNNIFKEYKVAIRPSYEISTNDFSYLTFRAYNSFSEFSEPSKLPPEAIKRAEEKAYSLDDKIHSCLQNHYNQIWYLDEELSYFPNKSKQQSLPKFMRIRSEWVKPDKGDAYDAVIKQVKEALVKAKYPIGYLVFSASYGDGACKFLWYADSKEQLQKLDNLEDVLLSIFGKEQAKELIQRWNECLIKVSDVDAFSRPELNNFDILQNWFAIPTN